MTAADETNRRSFEEARDTVRAPLWTLLRRHARPHLAFLAAGLVSTFTFYFVGMAPNYVVGVAFDGLFDPEVPYRLPLVPEGWIPDSSWGQLLLTVGLFVLIGLTQVLAKMVRVWAMSSFSLRFQHDMRVAAYDEVQRLETAFFEEHGTGEVMSILNNDVNQLEGFYTDELDDTLHVLATGLGLVVFLSLLNWQLMLVTLVVVPVFAAANYWFSGVIERLSDAVRASVGSLNARLENNVGGIATIKAYVREPYESDRVEAASEEYFESNWEMIKLSSGFMPSMQFLTGMAFVLTFVVGGYWLIEGPPLFFTEPMTVGVFAAFILYTRELTMPMRKITGLIAAYKQALASAKRIVGLQEAAMTIPEPDDPVALGHVRGRVQYDDVSFSYPRRSERAIDGVSFEIEPGETVGIVGPTGAGKSTLMKLLLRFYDIDEGAIRIDGVDVRDLELAELRSAVGYIGQEPFLFSGTVRENVAYGVEATDDEVIEAAKLAGAHEFVSTLPGGYDTEVGERGTRLSGGQRQRLALARAFVTDPPILVLDEATSQVDNETEAIIQRGVQSLIEDRTAFTIAHRLSTVRDADTILVLDDGRLVQAGSHEQLLEAGGPYANLWHLQVGEFDALPEEFVDRVTDLDLRGE